MTPAAAAAAWFVAGVLVASGCTGGDRDGADPPDAPPAPGSYALVVLADLTGPLSAQGTAIGNGARLAVEDANRAGPNGVEIVLHELDTRGDPAEAATLATATLEDDTVLGAVVSGAAGAPFAQGDLGAVSVGALDLPAPLPLHSLGGTREAAAAALVTYVAQTLQATSVVLFHTADAGGVRDGLVGAGVEIALDEGLDSGAESYPEAAAGARALAPPPDVVVYTGDPAAGGRLAGQLVDAGVRSRLVGDDRLLRGRFVEAAGAVIAGGTRAVCACLAPAGSGEAEAFARAYEARWGQPPGPYAAEGHAAARLLAEGILAGHVDRGSLLAYVTGAAAGHQPAPAGVYEVRDGRWVPLGPVGG